MSEESKKLVLARRAKFVAAALAGVSVACGKDPVPPPEPCLSVALDHRDAGPPVPCLTPVQADVDAGPPAGDAGSSAGPDAGHTTRSQRDAGAPPKPVPCLAPPLPTNTNTAKPPPRPCLSVVKPPDKESK